MRRVPAVHRIAAALGCALLIGGVAAAPGAAQDGQGPSGCMDYETHRQFDFWLGDWNVYAMNGGFAGRNTIERGAQGCVLHEHWRSASGGTGHSLNFVDPQTGRWRQIWTGTNHVIDYDGVLNGRGQMILTGAITYFDAEGVRELAFRGAWTRQADGAVIQHFQQWDPEGEKWTRWALLTYVPAETDPNGREPGEDATGPVIERAPDAFGAEAGAPR